METFFCTIVTLSVAYLGLLASPFIIDHVRETWYDPAPLHSGATPDSPTWHAPEPEDDPAFYRFCE